jgi:hypothetical protein
MEHSLPILNLAEARYECTYGRGCDGVCCREGRPLLYPEEVERLDANLDRIHPLLRTESRAVVRRKDYKSGRRRLGHPVVRNVAGWCVFFNDGCVLHKLGEAEGDKYRYKPCVCSLFPIQSDDDGNWYIRQHGYKNEKWDLFCLDPQNSARPAAESLREEIALAQHFEDEHLATRESQPATSERDVSLRKLTPLKPS